MKIEEIYEQIAVDEESAQAVDFFIAKIKEMGADISDGIVYKYMFINVINHLNEHDKPNYKKYYDFFDAWQRDLEWEYAGTFVDKDGNHCTCDRGGEYRICDICGNAFEDGYYDGDGNGKYYCSDECLHHDYTDEEWKEQYGDGEGDSYWSEW